MSNRAVYATIKQIHDDNWSVHYVDVDDSGADIVEILSSACNNYDKDEVSQFFEDVCTKTSGVNKIGVLTGEIQEIDGSILALSNSSIYADVRSSVKNDDKPETKTFSSLNECLDFISEMTGDGVNAVLVKSDDMVDFFWFYSGKDEVPFAEEVIPDEGWGSVCEITDVPAGEWFGADVWTLAYFYVNAVFER